MSRINCSEEKHAFKLILLFIFIMIVIEYLEYTLNNIDSHIFIIFSRHSLASASVFFGILISLIFVLSVNYCIFKSKNMNYYTKICYSTAISIAGYLYINTILFKYLFNEIHTWVYISNIFLGMFIIYNSHLLLKILDIKKTISKNHKIEMRLDIVNLILILPFIVIPVSILFFFHPSRDAPLYTMLYDIFHFKPENLVEQLVFAAYCWYHHIIYFIFISIITINIWANVDIIHTIQNRLKKLSAKDLNLYKNIDLLKEFTEFLVEISFYELLLIIGLFIYSQSYILFSKLYMMGLDVETTGLGTELIGLDKHFLILILAICITINFKTFWKIRSLVDTFINSHAEINDDILTCKNMSNYSASFSEYPK